MCGSLQLSAAERAIVRSGVRIRPHLPPLGAVLQNERGVFMTNFARLETLEKDSWCGCPIKDYHPLPVLGWWEGRKKFTMSGILVILGVVDSLKRHRGLILTREVPRPGGNLRCPYIVRDAL